MGIYLVCYFRDGPPATDLIRAIGNFLIGPIFHIEIAFIRYENCKRCYVTSFIKDGKPKFSDVCYIDDPKKYRIEMYRFKNVTTEQERECELLCERLVMQGDYKMDGDGLMRVALPSFFNRFTKRLFPSTFHGTYFTPNANEKSIYCVPLAALVTNALGIPTNTTETATDFFTSLRPYLEEKPEYAKKTTMRGNVEVLVSENNHRNKDRANILRSEEGLEEIIV